MPEPSLSEISNISTDPGLSGVAPEPVIDNSRVVDNLNNQARVHAENQFKKYNQFLENKKELFQNISDIQGLETLPEDKDYLHKQAGDILGEIMKNPSVITGGAGYGAIQSKIAKFKSDAMASKASALDEKTNKLFLDRNPDLYTDENVKAMEDAKKLPIGQRKSVMLQVPTILDEKTLFETALKNSVHDYSEPVEIGGKHYIENGKELSPHALQEQMNLALQSQKDKYGHTIESAVKLNFNKLDDDEKQKFKDLAEKNRTKPLEEYWKDRTLKYKDAYLPQGTYDEVPGKGVVRFGKQHLEDKQYYEAERLNLDKQKLAEERAYHQNEIALGYARLGVEKDKLKNVNDDDQQGGLTVISNAASVLNNATPLQTVGKGDKTGKTKRTILRISDPTLLEEFGKVNKEGKKVEIPDAINYDPETNQPVLVYFNDDDKAEGKTDGVKYKKEVPLDQRTWLNVITRKEFPNKDIGGINKSINAILGANGNNLYGISQKLKNPAPGQASETKSYKIKGKAYTKADLKKMGYTDDQINQAIKSGTIK